MSDKITIKAILSEMKSVVENGDIRGPGWWLDQAMSLTALWQDLIDEKTKYEMAYKKEQVKLMEEGKKISESERIVEATSENYRMYNYLKGRDKIIEQMIMLSKKRSQIESF